MSALRSSPLVLLVDDSEVVRFSYGQVLRNAGFSVQEASIGADALRLAANGPDLVLLDVELPDLTGHEVCRRLKADPATASIPILQISGQFVTSDERVEGLDGGADDYLVKPLNSAELLARVRAALRVRQSEARLEQRFRERSAELLAAQEALRASEARFRAIVEQSYDAFVIVAPDGTMVYASPTVVRIGGRTPEELVGRNAFEWSHADDAAGLSTQFREFQARPGESVTVQHRFLHKDGSWRWVEATCTNFLAEPSVQGIVCSFHDVTEQRLAEEARSHLAAIVESTGDAILSADLSGTIRTWNRGAERLFGYTAGEIVGSPVLVLIPPEGHAQVAENIGCIRRGEPIPTFEVQRLRKGGVPVTVAVNLSAMRQAGGEISGICAIYRDITRHKEIENKIREWKDRYEAAVRATGQILYDWDVNSNAVEWGGSLEATLGYTIEEMPRLLDELETVLLHPDDREPFHREIERVIGTGEPFDLKYRVRRKDGSYRMVHDRGHFVCHTAGRSARMIGFLMDITDQVRLEEQFRQAQKMEAIGRLAGGVAHDFNNLLTIINGYSDLVLQSMNDHDTARPLLAEVRKAGSRAAALTGQLLAFSRRQIVQQKVVDLNALVSDLQKMLARVIGEDVELTTTLRPGLHAMTADPAQLEQIILNLAVNSRDAMPDGGRLSIRTENAVLEAGYADDHSEVRPGRYVLLSISDTGCGMSGEMLTHIFEPFFTTKEPGRGTGLGLATVYGITRQFGGHIRVRSEPGRGSTFDIYFPAIERPAAESDAAEGRELPRGSETVLLVEDEDGVRAVTARMVRQFGYEVLAAANGAQALELAQQHEGPLALLMTDVVMPGLDGRHVAENLRTCCPGISVLYLSGYTEDAVVRHGISQSEVAFLQKPFSMATLARSIRDAIDGPVRV